MPQFKIAGHSTGYLKLSISAHLMSEGSEDGMTEVSGMTGMTSNAGALREQDLEGGWGGHIELVLEINHLAVVGNTV